MGRRNFRINTHEVSRYLKAIKNEKWKKAKRMKEKSLKTHTSRCRRKCRIRYGDASVASGFQLINLWRQYFDPEFGESQANSNSFVPFALNVRSSDERCTRTQWFAKARRRKWNVPRSINKGRNGAGEERQLAYKRWKRMKRSTASRKEAVSWLHPNSFVCFWSNWIFKTSDGLHRWVSLVRPRYD